MRPPGRVVPMVTAGLALTGLCYLVAVAAHGLPGSAEREPLLDFVLRADIDLRGVLGWVLLGVAVIGAVVLILGVREARPGQRRGSRNLVAFLVGFVLFLVVLRFLQPLTEGLFMSEAASGDNSAPTATQPQTVGSAGWLLTILLAAVIAAALTRVGIAIKGSPVPYADGEDSGQPLEPLTGRPGSPVQAPVAADARGRIIAAYAGLENALAGLGFIRRPAETSRKFMHRMQQALELESGTVESLLELHATARFSTLALGDRDALVAESVAGGLAQQAGEA